MANMVVTITETTVTSVKKIRFDWLSDDAAATASGTTTAEFDGMLIAVITDPDAGGTQPDDNYNITLTDADGTDLLLGNGLLRDETNIERIASTSLAGVAGSKLTLSVDTAGNANGGIVDVYIR